VACHTQDRAEPARAAPDRAGTVTSVCTEVHNINQFVFKCAYWFLISCTLLAKCAHCFYILCTPACTPACTLVHTACTLSCTVCEHFENSKIKCAQRGKRPLHPWFQCAMSTLVHTGAKCAHPKPADVYQIYLGNFREEQINLGKFRVYKIYLGKFRIEKICLGKFRTDITKST